MRQEPEERVEYASLETITSMKGRAQASPGQVTGVIITLLITGIIAFVGLIIISSLAERCPESGPLVSTCESISVGFGVALSNSVGPVSLIIAIIVILIAISSQAGRR